MEKFMTILIAFLGLASGYTQEMDTIVDNFNSNNRNWLIENNEGSSTEIRNGSYNVTNHTEGFARVYTTDIVIDPDYDYSISAKIKETKGEEYFGYGLIWGFDSWDNYLNFLMSENGHICVYGFKNKEFFWVLEWTEISKSYLHMTGQSNTLKIDKRGDQINYFINDSLVCISENIEFTGTQVGFKMDAAMSLSVDDLEVTCKKREINLVSNPINGFELENLGPKINSETCEKGQLISADGKTLYYTRENPDTLIGAEIRFSEKDKKGRWGSSQNIGAPFNNNGHNALVSITPDGNTALLTGIYNSDGSANKTMDGMSLSYKREGEWSLPVKIEIEGYVNVNRYLDFCLTPDGTRLIVVAENDSSYGALDLFISFIKEDGTWGVPQNMGTVINTFANEFSPFIAPDGKTLFFASYGHPGFGQADIFMTKRLDDTWINWSAPQNLGSDINSSGWDAYYKTSAVGDYAYMVSNDTKDSQGSCDLFQIENGSSLKPDPVILVIGKVYNGQTNEVMDAEIRYENLNTGNSEGIAYSNKKDGYKIILPKGTKYGFRAELEGYIAISQNIDLTDLDTYEERVVDLILIPLKKGETIKMNNLFFDVGKSLIRSESILELNRLVKVMEKNPEMKIQITGHTDNQGSDDVNLKLSTDRAEAVKNYLVSQGIGEDRITFIGAGSSQPIKSNKTPEGRKANRRVEFVIL